MEDSPLDNLQQQLTRLTSDVQALARARYELAQVELKAAGSAVRRLSLGALVAVLLVLVGSPLFLVALAEALERLVGGDRILWLVALGASCFGLAGLLAYRVWMRFRQEYAGLEQSLEELQADAAWWRSLVESAGRPEEMPKP